jgi:hypothetical protein
MYVTQIPRVLYVVASTSEILYTVLVSISLEDLLVYGEVMSNMSAYIKSIMNGEIATFPNHTRWIIESHKKLYLSLYQKVNTNGPMNPPILSMRSAVAAWYSGLKYPIDTTSESIIKLRKSHRNSRQAIIAYLLNLGLYNCHNLYKFLVASKGAVSIGRDQMKKHLGHMNIGFIDFVIKMGEFLILPEALRRSNTPGLFNRAEEVGFRGAVAEIGKVYGNGRSSSPDISNAALAQEKIFP